MDAQSLLSIDVVTLRTWLSSALTARHSLLTGDREVSFRRGTTWVQYSESQVGELDAYIALLQSAITAREQGLTKPRRGPIYLGFK
jgi:hypothetical protein